MVRKTKFQKVSCILMIINILFCSIFVQQFTILGYDNDYEGVGNESLPDNLEESYRIDFAIEAEWKNHYNGTITIKNISEKDIDNWKISFISKSLIENIWCASIESHDDDTYVIKNVGWNQDIKAGEEISFGFTASYVDELDEPHDFYMSQVCKEVKGNYKISYRVISEWDSGIVGEICVENYSDKTIEDWCMSFCSNIEIEQFWTAEISHCEDNYYYIKNRGYNQNIESGESLVLGFAGRKANRSDVLLLEHFNLYCIGVYEEDTADSDSDGLYDSIEISIGTDANNIDSDSDGLNDYVEFCILNTNPLEKDSDKNGIIDDDEDLDFDGLSNQAEITLGTDSLNMDSDGDRLLDGEEVNKYHTDPLKQDSDGDTLSDYAEIVLNLNPLSVDTDENGTIDAEEKIEQDYQYDIEDESAFVKFEINMSTNLFLEDELFIMQDECTEEGSISDIIELDSESLINQEIGTISFRYDKKYMQINPRDMVIYGYQNDEFVLLNTNINEKECMISTDLNKIYSAYYVGVSTETPIKTETDELQIKLLSVSKKYGKANLISDMKKNVKKDRSINKMNPRKNSVEEAVNLVVKYDKSIDIYSEMYHVKKEMIQSILARELICADYLDSLSDIAVQNYYHNKAEFERYCSLKWYQQLVYGRPNYRYPEKEDSSTGLGQIFARTAMKAREYTLMQGENHYSYNNWKQRKKIWYLLKDNDNYNIEMICRVLLYEAKKTSLKNPSKQVFQKVVGAYNGNIAYGKKLYEYRAYFAKYNKYN